MILVTLLICFMGSPAEAVSHQRLSLVYAANSFNHPSSIFGHIFLVFHNEPIPELTSTAIYFAAEPKATESELEYLLNGILGKTLGKVQNEYFYDLIKQYNYTENRNLYVFPINIKTEGIERITNYINSINSKIPYYFFSENCVSFIDVVLSLEFKNVENLNFQIRSPKLLLYKYQDHLADGYLFQSITNKLKKIDSLSEKQTGSTYPNATEETTNAYLFNLHLLAKYHSGSESAKFDIENLYYTNSVYNYNQLPISLFKNSKQENRISLYSNYLGLNEVSLETSFVRASEINDTCCENSKSEFLNFYLDSVNNFRFSVFNISILNPVKPYYIKPSWRLKSSIEHIGKEQKTQFTGQLDIGLNFELDKFSFGNFIRFNTSQIDFQKKKSVYFSNFLKFAINESSQLNFQTELTSFDNSTFTLDYEKRISKVLFSFGTKMSNQDNNTNIKLDYFY